MVLAQTEQNHQVGMREDQRPSFHHLADDDGQGQASGSLNLVVNETQEEPSGHGRVSPLRLTLEHRRT